LAQAFAGSSVRLVDPASAKERMYHHCRLCSFLPINANAKPVIVGAYPSLRNSDLSDFVKTAWK